MSSKTTSLLPIHPAALLAVIKINLLRRPLWKAELVEESLGIPRKKLVGKIESGEIAWAWDIGRGNSKQELRVLGHCVVELQTGPIAGIGSTKNLGLSEVLNLILPQVRPTLRGIELQRLFSMDAKSVQRMHQNGWLKRITEQLPKTGPSASPRFTCASVAELLAKRRVA